MLTIRLARSGAKKRPFYHIVATDSRHKRDGRYIERLGYFNPIATGGELRLKVDQARVTHWSNQGAQLSERVLALVKEAALRGEEGEVKARAKPEPKAAKPAQAKEEPKPAEDKAESKVEAEESEAQPTEEAAPDADAQAGTPEESPAAEEKPSGDTEEKTEKS